MVTMRDSQMQLQSKYCLRTAYIKTRKLCIERGPHIPGSLNETSTGSSSSPKQAHRQQVHRSEAADPVLPRPKLLGLSPSGGCDPCGYKGALPAEAQSQDSRRVLSQRRQETAKKGR